MRPLRTQVLAMVLAAGALFSAGCLAPKEKPLQATQASVFQDNLVTRAVLGEPRDFVFPKALDPEHWLQLSALTIPSGASGIYSEGDVRLARDTASLTALSALDTTKYHGDSADGAATRQIKRYQQLFDPRARHYSGPGTDSADSVDRISITLKTEHLCQRGDGWRDKGTSVHLRGILETFERGSAKAGGLSFALPHVIRPLDDVYAGLYRKSLTGAVLPEVAAIKAQGVRWVFPRDWRDQWANVMHVVAQYPGILDLSSRDTTAVVVFRRVVPGPAGGEIVPRYVAALLAVAVVGDGQDRTAVYCAALKADGTVAALKDWGPAGAPADAAASWEVGPDSYGAASEELRRKLVAEPPANPAAEPAPTPQGRTPAADPSDASGPMRARALAVSVCRFYRELAIQTFAPSVWQQKFPPSSAAPPGPTGESPAAGVPGEGALPEWRFYVDPALDAALVLRRSVAGLSAEVLAPGTEEMLRTVAARLQRAAEKARPPAPSEESAPSKEETRGRRFTVHLVASPDVLAFALPDGSLYLTSGLLDALDRPQELAAVLAHEMGHVVNKDAARLLERLAGRAKRIEEAGPSDAAACQAAASAAVSSCFMGLSTAPMKALRQVLLSGYGEEAEVQADLFAARVLADAGYDRQALANVLARLQGQKEAPAGAQGPLRQRLLWGLGEKSAGIGVRLERLRQLSAPKS